MAVAIGAGEYSILFQLNLCVVLGLSLLQAFLQRHSFFSLSCPQLLSLTATFTISFLGALTFVDYVFSLIYDMI